MASNALPRPPADAALPDQSEYTHCSLVAQQEETTHSSRCCRAWDEMPCHVKCFLVVFLVVFFGGWSYAAATWINAGPLPTCGCPPGYLEGGSCACSVSHRPHPGGYWDCIFDCPNEQNQYGVDCWMGPDLNNEQRKHEEYHTGHTYCPSRGT
jgi:hypothetical protein